MSVDVMIEIVIAVDDKGKCAKGCEWYNYDWPDCGPQSTWCSKEWDRWEKDKFGVWAYPTDKCPGPGRYRLMRVEDGDE